MSQTSNYGFPLLADTPPEGMTGKDLRDMILGEGETSLAQMMDKALKNLSDTAQTKDNLMAEYDGVDGAWVGASAENYPSTLAVMRYVKSVTVDPWDYNWLKYSVQNGIVPSLGMVDLDTVTWDGVTDNLPCLLGVCYKVSTATDQPKCFRVASTEGGRKVFDVLKRSDALMAAFGVAMYGYDVPYVFVADRSGTIPAAVVEQMTGSNPGVDVPYEAGTYLMSNGSVYISSATGLVDAKTYIDQKIAALTAQ